MATKFTVTPTPTPVATDVFNEVNVDPFLKPDKTLADLEAKLRKATGDAAVEIQKQIDARQAELSSQYGSVGFGSGGYVVPNYAYSESSGAQYSDLLAAQKATAAALAGKMQLTATGSYYVDPVTGQSTNLNPIYQAQYYGPQGQVGWIKDPVTGELVDPMNPDYMNKLIYSQIAGTADPKNLLKTFYDANGNPLSAAQVAKTAQGIGQARAGWDIGFGPGMIAPGVSAKNMSEDELRGLTVNNLAASGELTVAGYNPVTGSNMGVNGTGTNTGSSLSVSAAGAYPVPTGPVLASDVFKQTLAMFFGPAETSKPWVNELYTSVSKFYKTGSTVDEAFNLALQDVRKNPTMAEFTKRFKGIYALQDMKQAGQAVTVPTIAEYFATESKMGDILKQSSLGDLANEDFLGDVLGKGVSATEFANRITAIFDRIDKAPQNIKDTISRYFPSVDRISLAKAIALGDKGAKELQNQVAGYEVLSAAEKQGLGATQLVGGLTEEKAYQYALGGETYDTALTKFGTVAAALPTVNKLTQVYGEPTLGQAGVEAAIFGKSAAELKALENLTKKEEASFSGRSGVSQASLASQRRGAGLI